MRHHALFHRLLLIALATVLGVDAPAQSATPAPKRTANAQVTRNYLLAPDDVIEVRVFQEEDLTTRARISHDGVVNFPLLGSVQVGGRTLREAGELIRQKLSTRFLVNPQVSVTVIEHARRLFTVLGQVQRAGTYRFPDRESLNLIQAIGMAGGYNRIADPGRITLKRQVNGREEVLRLDAKSMARDQTALFPILPGDIITVGERFF